MTDIYRSRWDVCDDCECATLVQRDDDRGVPDPNDWEEFGQCMVCGGSLKFYNADQQTVADNYWAKGKAYGAVKALEAMASVFRDLEMNAAAALVDQAIGEKAALA